MHDLQFHNLTSQQTQCPLAVALGRVSHSHGDDFRFLFTVQQFLDGWRGPLLTLERLFKAALDETPANILHGLGSTIQCFGDLCVSPTGVGFQENIRSFHLLACSLEFPHDLLTDLAFLIRQFHDKLLDTHGDLLVGIEGGVNSQEYLLEAKSTQP